MWKFVFPDRCDSERLPRCGPGTFCHRQQDPEDPEVQRSGPRPARGPVPPDQEGCGRQEAPGEKQKGTNRCFSVKLKGRFQDYYIFILRVSHFRLSNIVGTVLIKHGQHHHTSVEMTFSRRASPSK